MGWVSGEGLRKSGFWSQLLLLALVDWATVHAFLHQRVHWLHYAGFVVVNLLLLAMTLVVWRWLRKQKSPPPDLFQRP